MKLRTEQEFQEYIDKEMGWRIKEIHLTKDAIRAAAGNTQTALLRAGVAILYAHWEGFVKRSSMALLNFVVCRRLTYRELKPCFVAHGIANQLEILARSKKHDMRSAVVRFVMSELSQSAVFDEKSVLRRHGNLTSETFKSLAAATAIDVSRYETRFNWIDRELVAKRNNIAHGAHLEIDADKFPTMVEETLLLLRWFKNDIESCVSTRGYLGP